MDRIRHKITGQITGVMFDRTIASVVDSVLSAAILPKRRRTTYDEGDLQNHSTSTPPLRD
jgi:hypothetical protein